MMFSLCPEERPHTSTHPPASHSYMRATLKCLQLSATRCVHFSLRYRWSAPSTSTSEKPRMLIDERRVVKSRAAYSKGRRTFLASARAYWKSEGDHPCQPHPLGCRSILSLDAVSFGMSMGVLHYVGIGNRVDRFTSLLFTPPAGTTRELLRLLGPRIGI